LGCNNAFAAGILPVAKKVKENKINFFSWQSVKTLYIAAPYMPKEHASY
jgi:hypothetical protein